MDELKVIAAISRQSSGDVERVGTTGPRSSSLLSKAARVLSRTQYRRKTILVPFPSQSPLTRQFITKNFEALRQSQFLEYGPQFRWEWDDSTPLTLLTPWLDGETVADDTRHRDPLSALSPENLWLRLRVWARAFERLSQWHAAGVVHGNLKPQNILICDGLASDLLLQAPTEFFTRDENIPYVALIDGAYAHLMECMGFSPAGDSKVSSSIFWRPPEGLGLVEGSLTAASDVFSMAAIAAFDLGLIWPDTATGLHGIVEHIWPLFILDSDRLLIHKHSVVWQGKNPVSDTLRRVRTLLAKALHPLPERRSRGAREIAFDLLVIARRLSGLRDQEWKRDFEMESLDDKDILDKKRGDANRDLLPVSPALQNSLDAQVEIRENSDSKSSSRHWILARNMGVNVHTEVRRLAVRMALDGHHFLVFRVRHTEESFPFSALDTFLSLMLTRLERRNPQALADARRELTSQRHSLRLAREVLPSLKRISGIPECEPPHYGEICLTSRHESLHLAIDAVIRILFQVAHLDVVIIDDIQRADLPSLRVFLRQFQNSGTRLHLWVLGARTFESPRKEDLALVLREMQERDSYDDILSHAERSIAWSTRLNNLQPATARFLGALTCLPLSLTLQGVSRIAEDAIGISGLVEEEFHSGKQTLPALPADAVGTARPKPLPAATPLSDILAMESLEAAKDLGLLVEERESITGRIHSLHWVSERVSLSLMLLINQDIREHLFLKTAEKLAKENSTTLDWSQILHEAEVFLGTNPDRTAHATLSALMQASEQLLDFDSCSHIISRFEILEERLLRKRGAHSEILIPKIRERIADLASLQGEVETARKYYASVLLNTDDHKRRVVVAMKSFVPCTLKKHDERVKCFDTILQQAAACGFISGKPSTHPLFERQVPQILETVELMLTQKSALSGKDLLVRPLADLIDLEGEVSEKERLIYPTRSKAQRAQVLSQFARSAVGWIECVRVIPLILESLQASLEERHGLVAAEALLTLCLAAGMRLPPEVRQRALRITGELGARTNNDQLVLESSLCRAWLSFFGTGNLPECHRILESLRSRGNEMPRSHRVAFERLRLLVEFETHPPEALKTENSLARNYVRERLHQGILGSWTMGEAFLSGASQAGELESPGPEPTLPQLLCEIIDQTLLFCIVSIESGPLAAFQDGAAAFQMAATREWIADRESRLTRFPGTVEQALAEMQVIMPEEGGLAVSDPEALLKMAEAAGKAGFHGLSRRLCQKTGTSPRSLPQTFERPEEEGPHTTDIAGEAVALNYVLEFLHQLQWNLTGDSSVNSQRVALCLEKSIPPHHELVEGTIAQAVASAARRLKIRAEETKHEGNLAVPTEERRTG